MKSKNKLFIFTGAALAIVAVLLAITMSSGGNKTDAQQTTDSDKVQVVSAAVDFDAHKVIQPADIVVTTVKASEAPVGAVSDPTTIITQSYQLTAKKGDVLYQQYVEAPGIQNSIDPGNRAISLNVDTQGLMSGLVVDGDYVDIVFHARVSLQRIISMGGIEYADPGPQSQGQGSSDSASSSSSSDSTNSDGFLRYLDKFGHSIGWKRCHRSLSGQARFRVPAT